MTVGEHYGGEGRFANLLSEVLSNHMYLPAMGMLSHVEDQFQGTFLMGKPPFTYNIDRTFRKNSVATRKSHRISKRVRSGKQRGQVFFQHRCFADMSLSD